METTINTINQESKRKEHGLNMSLQLRFLEFLGWMDGSRDLPKKKNAYSPYSSPRIMKEFAMANKIANEIEQEFIEPLWQLNSTIAIKQGNLEKMEEKLREAQEIADSAAQDRPDDAQLLLRRAQKRLNDTQNAIRQAQADLNLIMEKIRRRKNINQDIRNMRIAAYWQGALKKNTGLPPNPNIEELLELYSSTEGIIKDADRADISGYAITKQGENHGIISEQQRDE